MTAYLVFILRRLLRLYPTLAVVLALAPLPWGALPSVPELLMLPGVGHDTALLVDSPVWSLWVELIVTPVLPLLFFVVRRGPLWAMPALFAAALVYRAVGGSEWPLWVGLFALGAWAASRLPALPMMHVPALLRGLGAISYPLYLCHVPLILAYGSAIGVAAAFPVAIVLHVAVERPSIAWSRAIGRRRAPPLGARLVEDFV